ncbi:MAG: aldo/keto reductase [Verrucomicrobiota bacterium]
MQYRKLGKSGIESSVIAIGSWAMGGWMWGGSNEKDSIAAIHAALDEGVNFIDTAPIYGFGTSEEIVGKAVKNCRDKVVLATKCGMVCRSDVGEFKFNATSRGADPDGHIQIRIYQGAESIRQEVEESLRRLQTDYIDLLQTHWQDSTTPIAETMETLLDLKNEGKIRAIGVSNASVEQMQEYLRTGQLDSDQEIYSMLDRDIEDEQLPFCRENDIAVLAYSPLARGLLTGKMTPERTFEPGDVRQGSPRFSQENRRKVAAMLEEFRPIAEEHNSSIAQLVTAWTFSQPGLTHVLCGMRNTDQAKENAGAGKITLSKDEVDCISGILSKQDIV